MKKALGLIGAALLGMAEGAAAQTDGVTVVTDVTVVDVAAGSVTEGQSILIQDGMIAAVGLDVEPQADAVDRLDGNGAFVIPGLWDSHVHIFSSPAEPDTALPLYLVNGIAGIRDMGALWSL